MGPASVPFAALLVVLFGGLIYVTAFRNRWWLKLGAAGLSFVLAAGFGIWIVNNYYGYYRTWGDLVTDLSGGPAATKVALGGGPVRIGTPSGTAPGHPGSVSAAGDTHPIAIPTPKPGQGMLLRSDLPGPISHIDRVGYVYLPAAYFAPRNARVRFPVLELFHGSPGSPTDWLTNLGVTDVLEREIAAGRAAPMVLVIPDTRGGPPISDDCVNRIDGDADDTYLTQDVPNDVIGSLRLQPTGAGWATMGFSTGGYCAANLAVRHPGEYAGAASFDGYFHVAERAYTGDLFRRHQNLIDANSPDYVLAHQVVKPLPKFWLQVGTGDTEDTADTFSFHTEVQALEPTPLVVEPGARHNYPSWLRALPAALDWASGVVHSSTGGNAVGGTVIESPPPQALLPQPLLPLPGRPSQPPPSRPPATCAPAVSHLVVAVSSADPSLAPAPSAKGSPKPSPKPSPTGRPTASARPTVRPTGSVRPTASARPPAPRGTLPTC